ncbi:MucR family transcriptional regulator [Aquamicrobium lusatiense]|uniref:MucR family transcriptional regulator n=1 Tax=Aquamicrobium lusatiense TaxID=89772 RepID=UPI0024545E09|nr:MucR family transcriptional regulator [Aquamicrobium lusatiense]MDH4992049.1 MucR family transcriptional regulator [Aquamicrobium lusatiense]
MTDPIKTSPNLESEIELTADIVSAYVSNNPVPASELGTLITNVHSAIASLGTKKADAPVIPAVNPKKSVHDDYIICLEDGKKFKSLKRHLSTHYGMTPEEYRAKWSLPADYPMVAPGYSATRSRLAKELGLGRAKEQTAKPKARQRKG